MLIVQPAVEWEAEPSLCDLTVDVLQKKKAYGGQEG